MQPSRLPSFACLEIVPLGYYSAVSPLRVALQVSVCRCCCGVGEWTQRCGMLKAVTTRTCSTSGGSTSGVATLHVYRDRHLHVYRDRHVYRGRSTFIKIGSMFIEIDTSLQIDTSSINIAASRLPKHTSSESRHHWVSHGQPQQPGRINVTPLPCRLARHFPLNVLANK
jgi:hypothetical protein